MTDTAQPWLVGAAHNPFPVLCAIKRLRAKGGSYEGSIADQVLVQDYAAWALARIETLERERSPALVVDAGEGYGPENGYARRFNIQEE